MTFDDFFAAGQKESISPFLRPAARRWGKHLPLRISLLSGLLLLGAFIASLFVPPLSSLLLVFVYLFCGTPALLSALEHVKAKEINIDVLMTLGAFAAALMGCALDGGLLLVLFGVSAGVEERVQKRAQDALFALDRISPRMAHCVREDGTLHVRAIREIDVGTQVLVKAGEIVPLDGTVVSGSAFVDLSHLTGESHPVAKCAGDAVVAGARALDGSLTLCVERSASDSTLQRIARMVVEGADAKPRVQRLFDRLSAIYAPCVIALSVGVATLLPLVLGIPFLGQEGSLYRALAFLIAASPCALILATPTAYLSALSSCAKRGIVLKGGTVLDALVQCEHVAFDKTGTLTSGELQCVGVDALHASSFSENVPLRAALALERHASHPMGRALDRWAEENGIQPYPSEDVHVLSGRGLQGVVSIDRERYHAYFGNARWMAEIRGAQLEDTSTDHSSAELLLLQGGAVAAHFRFHFADALRQDARPLIEALKHQFYKNISMLTGDRYHVASDVATRLGITHVAADLLPEDKLHRVATLAQQTGCILVGDGMNDAPALARATVGIALGKSASHSALDAADAILLKEDLSLLPFLLKKATHTAAIVKQNIGFALGCILLAAPISLIGDLPIWLAVVLHEGGTVLVSMNALRLLR